MSLIVGIQLYSFCYNWAVFINSEQRKDACVWQGCADWVIQVKLLFYSTTVLLLVLQHLVPDMTDTVQQLRMRSG